MNFRPVFFKTLKTPQKTVRPNKFSKAVEYKVTTEKSVVFLYTNYKLPDKEMMKTISISKSIIKNKILRNKLN